MHGVFPAIARPSSRRSPRTWTKKTPAQGIVFRDIAQLTFPEKTLAALGHELQKAGVDCSRSALANYLNGSRDVPGCVQAVVFAEMMRQLARRP